MADETSSELYGRMSDDGAGNLATDAEIQQNFRSEFEDYGIVFDDIANVPVTASVRASGLFTEPGDMAEYLEQGGLISTANGDPVPLGWVYFLSYFDDDLQEDVYQVYIDEDSN